jgi:hypothetical protein
MKTQRLRVLAPLALAALTLTLIGCLKVRPTPYQVGLKAYYSALLSEKTEESLKTAIANLDKEMAKNPSDAGMLALRASAYLDLVRLGVQKPGGGFDAQNAEKLFRDLRLLQTHAEEANAKLWLKPRVSTMAGDAFILRAESIPPATESKPSLIRSARQAALYQLAADFYLHAWAAAQIRATGDDAAAEGVGLAKEKDNARDGYVSAISGVAKTKRVLGFPKEARELTQLAIDLTTKDLPPSPTLHAGLTPDSLYAYPHAVLKTQYESMEVLTTGNYPERVGFAESALKEDLSSRLLHSTPDVTFTNEQIATRLLTYYAALTARVQDLSATGAGNINSEAVSFRLFPGARSVSSDVSAFVEYISLMVGEEKVRVDLDDAIVPPGGLSLTIRSRTGSPSGNSTHGLVLFLNRSNSFFAGGAEVQVLGPGENAIGSVTAQ